MDYGFWGFWTAIAFGAGGIALSIYVYVASRKKKDLGYKLLSVERILTSPVAVPTGLKVVFKGEPVHDPHQVSLRLENAGQIPIAERDFAEPLLIHLDKARLLDAAITRKSRQLDASLDLVHSSAGLEIRLNPCLIQQGEWLEIKCVSDGRVEPLAVRVSCRIEGLVPGIINLDHLRARRKLRRMWIQTSLAALLAVGVPVGNAAVAGRIPDVPFLPAVVGAYYLAMESLPAALKWAQARISGRLKMRSTTSMAWVDE